MRNTDYDIGELLQRDVYVNDIKVGTIVGERHHPNDARVQSVRLQVEPGVADEFMRKPTEYAPLSKELVHSIRGDGTVKLSKSMRELQRRWRNTVRIDEKLYAPDETLDRAVLDNQGDEIGVIVGLYRVKRTYKGVARSFFHRGEISSAPLRTPRRPLVGGPSPASEGTAPWLAPCDQRETV